MFTPKYIITNKILRNIGIIDACREVITNAPLVPLWEAKFREEAIIRTIHYGTHIEGNELNLSEAARVVLDAQVKQATAASQITGVVGRERDIQEVINYRNVLKYIEEFSHQVPQGDVLQKRITEEAIKKTHQLTTEKILASENCGSYRQQQVVIKNSQTGEITFYPPPPVEVPFQMEDFLDWLNGQEGQDCHPVVKSGITHYELVRIHPFLDGNGRTSRAVASLVLFLGGYDVKKFFSLEEHYDKDAARYYEALQSVQKSSDHTLWLEYFIEGLAIELTRIKEKVLALSKDLKLKKEIGDQVSLSARQIKLVEQIQTFGFIKNKSFKEVLPMVSEDTVLRDLQDLIKKRIIKKEGTTKAARYVMR